MAGQGQGGGGSPPAPVFVGTAAMPLFYTNPGAPDVFGAGTCSDGKYLYIACGERSDSSYPTTLQRARIMPNGQLETFHVIAEDAAPRQGNVLVSYGNRLYNIGGVDTDGNCVSTIEVWTVDANGHVVGKTQQGITPSDGFSPNACAIYGEYLYIFGGIVNPDETSSQDVWSARIGVDGQLGKWQLLASMPDASDNANQFVAWGGYAYCYAGDGDTDTGVIYSAKLMPSGQIGNWNVVSQAPFSIFFGQFTVVGNRLLNSGGVNGVTFTADTRVWMADLVPGGGAQNWRLLGSLNKARTGPGIAAVGDHLFVACGLDPSGSDTIQTVESTQIID